MQETPVIMRKHHTSPSAMCGSGKRRVNVSASWMTPCPQQRYCCPAACFLVKVDQMFLFSISAIDYLHWRCAKSSLYHSWLSGFRTVSIARGRNIKDGEKETVCCNNIKPFRLIQVNKPSIVARETQISRLHRIQPATVGQ